MASTVGFSSTPASIRGLAPPLGAFSSAGWKMSFTVPGSSLRIPQSTLAAQSSMAACVSCPQACMTPSFSLEKARPVFSVTGSASISARIATQPPGFSPFIRATTPVGRGRSTLSQPKLFSSSAILSLVRNSSLESSGWRWKSRRQEIISSKFSCTLLLISLILICPFFDQSGAREKRWTARAPGPVRRRRIILNIRQFLCDCNELNQHSANIIEV